MKKSSLLALIGVGLMILINLYYLLTNHFALYEYFYAISTVANFINIVAWVLIGQFFFKLYNKTK